MTSLDVLYLSLAVSALAVAGAIWFMVLRVARILEQTEPILRDMRNITKDVKDLETTVKDSVVMKGLGFISSILKKRGTNE